MKEKINKVCSNPIAILGAGLISLIIGGTLGILAYYGQWLG
ncbi:hypothetical protein [Clostridium gallinarum]|nr:hypothetical protein [Clostridium gallinarum]